MAKQIIPVPEKFAAQFQELVDLDTKIYDLKQEHTIKSTVLWTEVEKELNLRGRAIKFDKDTFTIKVFDNTKDEEEEFLKRVREGKIKPFNKIPMNIDEMSMGKALPQMRMPKVGFWQRVKNSFKSE